MSGLVLRLGLYILAGLGGLVLIPPILLPLGGTLVTAAFTVFFAAIVANLIPIRIFERGRLEDCGLGWFRRSLQELLTGLGLGVVFASAVVLIPVAMGQAHFAMEPGSEHPWSSFGFVAISLLFGAFGEELLFHGYGFQLLAAKFGQFAAILPVALLFGLVHSGNQGANRLGILNTVLWGAVLGYACLRTRALWLPIGLHYGWNLAFPLLGADLSGFTMRITGYALKWTGSSLWSGGEYGPEGGVLTTVAAACVALILSPVLRKVAPPQGDLAEPGR